MTLPFLRSWRRATYNNFITRVGVASSAPARLSRRSATQAAWQPNLCRGPARWTPHSHGQYHQSSGSPIRRLYSHQATAEDSEPAALSVAPDETTTAFQRRRLRARQLYQADSSQNSVVRPRKNPHRLPKPHKALRRNDRRLGKADRATQEVHLGKGTRAPKFRKGGDQEYSYFNKWAPLEAADVEHLQAVQAAAGAARKAEDLARWAEKATEAASTAIVSSNETSAIQLADAARTEAELAALDAEQKAQLAEDKEEAAETLRAEMRARVEKRFPYLIQDRTKFGFSDKVRGLLLTPCRICHAPHSLNGCPLLFPTLDRRDTEVDPRYRNLFRDRLALDKKFREAIGYIQSTFQVSSGSLGEVIPLARSVTRDAPASAIKYLQEFDARIVFKNVIVIGGKHDPGRRHIPRSWDIQPGYYVTKDDDGKTFVIYWNTNAPADVTTDSEFLLELQKIRSFVAAWGRGEKARYGQDPFSDIPSIDMVTCVGRWHRTRASSDDMHRAVLSLWISNEELWKQGLYYKGIHVGTKDDEITSEYDWWSYGRPHMHGSPTMDLQAAPIPSSTSEISSPVAKGLLRATLRNVMERVPPILSRDMTKGDPVTLSHYKKYQAIAKHRGSRKYGKASVQARLISHDFRGAAARGAVGHHYPHWAPSWEIMMRLDAETQTADARKPRPRPRTVRRQRLLHPRPPPVSEPASTGHPPRASGYQMRSIMFSDTAPVTNAVSSSDAGTPVVDPVSTPSDSSQQKNPEFQIRKYVHSADSAQKNTNPSSKTDADSAGRGWHGSNPQGHRTQLFLLAAAHMSGH